MHVLPPLLCAIVLASAATADPVRIEAVEAMQRGDGWVISVTIRHTDTGWEDYADGWRVEAPDGTILAVNDLRHPHVTEQPFTRSKTGIAIPDHLNSVSIRARSVTDGWSDRTVAVTLSR